MTREFEVSVSSVVGNPLCVASNDGQKVYDKLKPALEADQKTVLSFHNVSLLTPAFLSTALGQLYGSFDEEKIRDLLKVQDISPEDQNLLKHVIETAKDYFRNPQQFSRIVNEELGVDNTA